jgi:L,D-transpeptidase YcbB
MLSLRHRAVLGIPTCALWFIAIGCKSTPSSPQAANTAASEVVAGQLRTIAGAGTLADLTWPGFPDYSQPVQELYEAVGYAPVWVRDGQASSQAQAIITAIEASRTKGLNPEEYDASRWPSV